jgi:hypothetical protein
LALVNPYLARAPEFENWTLLKYAHSIDYSSRNPGGHLRGGHGAKPYVLQVWPRYQPDPENEVFYEGWCYAQMILHHPFSNPEGQVDSWKEVLLAGCNTWAEA